jgi:hypothetical protein
MCREEVTPSKKKKKEKRRAVPPRRFRTAEDHDADMVSFRFKGGKQTHDGVLIKHGVPSRPHVQVADQVVNRQPPKLPDPVSVPPMDNATLAAKQKEIEDKKRKNDERRGRKIQP